MPTYRERIQKNEGKGKIVREWSREHMRKKGNKRERGHEKEKEKEKKKRKREGTRER